MDVQNKAWQKIPVPHSPLTSSEEEFLKKYSPNAESTMEFIGSLKGKTYEVIIEEYKKFLGHGPEREELELYKIVGLDLILKRCMPEKDTFYDLLMSDDIDDFVSIVKDR